jgi:hypothetical protein
LFNSEATITIEQKFFTDPPDFNQVALWADELIEDRGETIATESERLVSQNGSYTSRSYQTESQIYEEAYFVEGNSGIIIQLQTTEAAKDKMTEIYSEMIESFKVEDSLGKP